MLIGEKLAQAQVEGLRTLITGAGFELDLGALTQVLELNLRRQARAMEKDLVAAVVGNDKAETLVLDYLLDRAGHHYLLGQTMCSGRSVSSFTRRKPTPVPISAHRQHFSDRL